MGGSGCRTLIFYPTVPLNLFGSFVKERRVALDGIYVQWERRVMQLALWQVEGGRTLEGSGSPRAQVRMRRARAAEPTL